MTLQVGRVTGLRPDPGWSRSGDTLTFTGTFKTTQYRDPAEIDVRRMQVQNLPNNPDEEFYPVIYTPDPSLNGYYRVLDSSVSALGPIRNGAGRWSITLERVPDSSNPRQETAFMSAYRANAHSLTSGTGLLGAIPIDGSNDYDAFTFSGYTAPGATVGQFAIAGGGTIGAVTGTVSTARRGSFLFSLVPQSHYVGAATIEQQIGSTWYPVVGRQTVSALMPWRISNGRTRLEGSIRGRVTLSFWNSLTAAWESIDVVGHTGSAQSDRFHALLAPFASPSTVLPVMSIIQNDPGQVVIRYDSASGKAATFTLRRGSTWVEVTWSDPDPLSTTDGEHGLQFRTTPACTALPGNVGLRTNGVSSWFGLMTPHAVTLTAASGLIMLNNLTANKTFLLGGTTMAADAIWRDQGLVGTWAKTQLVVR
jgi:hypothetical protein